jgi:hypothetical protein
MDELKPCPFCGGKAKHFYCTPNGQHFWNAKNAVICGVTTSHSIIVCDKCGIRTKAYMTEKGCFHAWNRRVDNG